MIIADAANNRVQEIDKVAGTQWGKSMAASDIYTIAGSPTGTAGTGGDAGLVASALLDYPQAVVWSSPNLYIADAVNSRVQEMAGSTGTFWGQSMTSGDMYLVFPSFAVSERSGWRM